MRVIILVFYLLSLGVPSDWYRVDVRVFSSVAML